LTYLPMDKGWQTENVVSPLLYMAPKLDIENVYNFCIFYKALVLQSIWNGDFFEFGDNGLLSCIRVVGLEPRKWGCFWGASCAVQCA